MTLDHGLSRYKNGPDEHGNPGRCRCTRCREANAAWQAHRERMIAYGRWDGWTDAAGTKRRLQALMWNGWSLGLLSTRLGCSRQVLRRKLHFTSHATASTAAQVRALYDELWDQAPPEGTQPEKRAATMARRQARERGYVPALAWDDDTIDDPDATPADGWERRDVRRYGTLADEAAELIQFGVEPWRAAERLGVTQKTLEKTLARKAQEDADAAA